MTKVKYTFCKFLIGFNIKKLSQCKTSFDILNGLLLILVFYWANILGDIRYKFFYNSPRVIF